MTRPLVSIVICNYNYAAYLDAAIGSALGQTYSPIEIIVVDDGSTDHSSRVLERYAGRVSIVCKRNGGQVSAYNEGFARSAGGIVFFLDADDQYDAGTVAAVVDRFTSEVARVHFRLRLIDPEGKAMGGEIPTLLASGDDTKSLLDNGILYPSSPGSGNAYARAAITKLMPIPTDPDDRHGADFFLIFGSGLLGRVEAIETSQGSYRVHRKANGSNYEQLVLGNAAKSADEPQRQLRRNARFVKLIGERLGGATVISRNLTDISLEKFLFAVRVLDSPSYLAGIRNGLTKFPRLLRILRLTPGATLRYRLQVVAWMLVVCFSPRPVSARAARYGTNPSVR